MDITISVSSGTEEVLKRGAAARGKAVPEFASELLARASDLDAAAIPEKSGLEQGSSRSDALISQMRESSKTLSAGHKLNDDRDAIYAGCRE